MRNQKKPDTENAITLLPGTFTTGYRRDLELARKLILERREAGSAVRTRVVS